MLFLPAFPIPVYIVPAGLSNVLLATQEEPDYGYQNPVSQANANYSMHVLNKYQVFYCHVNQGEMFSSMLYQELCAFFWKLWGLPQWSTGWDCASSAGGMGSIPDQGTKIPHAAQHSQKVKIKKKKEKKIMSLISSPHSYYLHQQHHQLLRVIFMVILRGCVRILSLPHFSYCCAKCLCNKIHVFKDYYSFIWPVRPSATFYKIPHS